MYTPAFTYELSSALTPNTCTNDAIEEEQNFYFHIHIYRESIVSFPSGISVVQYSNFITALLHSKSISCSGSFKHINYNFIAFCKDWFCIGPAYLISDSHGDTTSKL